MKHRKTFAALLTLLVGAFIACSNGNDGENESQQAQTVTVTYYGDTTSTTPRAVSLESGSTLSEKLATAPDGYDFEAWISADGTDWTNRAITGDITLFAYFVKSSSSTSGTMTTTTTSEKSVESDKTTTVTTDSESGTTITKVEETTTKIGSTETIETESTTTKSADGKTTSESTVTTKDADGNTTSKVETTVAADGTTTTKTTDASGKTTTETAGGSEEKLEVSLNEAGYPTFEIAIPQDSDIYIETLDISIYRKKNGDAAYSKILDVNQNRKDSFEINPTYEFTDWYVAKDASYSYYYQISGENKNGDYEKTSGKSDFVSITNGKFGELTASLSGGEISFNAKNGIMTLNTLPTVTKGFSFMLMLTELDYGHYILHDGKYYKIKGDTIDLYISTLKGKTVIPYWKVYLYESDDYIRKYWYPAESEFYGSDYGLPESVTIPTEISTDSEKTDTTLAGTTYKSTELKMNGSAAPGGVSESITFDSNGKLTLTGYYNAAGTYTVSGTSVTVNYTSGDILGTMTGTLSDSNATITAQGTVTVSGKSILMYGVFAKQGEGTETIDQSTDAVSANADGTYTVTPYNISATLAAIAEKGDTQATLTITGATNSTVSKISEALKANGGISANVTLAESSELTNLPSSAFQSCTSLKTMALPDNVYLGEKCFQDCTSLTNINIPASGTAIPSRCFDKCSNLISITIPETVNSVGGYAFRKCSSLAEVSISSSVTDIYMDAFSDCTSLATVNFDGNVEQWCSIYFGDEEANPIYYAKSLKINGETLATAKISAAAKIKQYSFYNCESLTSVYMSDSVKSIGYAAFFHCTGLENITISNNLVEIGAYAFGNCSSLNGSLTIPNEVTEILDRTFYGCKKLESISLGSKVTSIGYAAFSYCTALESINLPETLTSISREAFYNCTALKGTIIIPSGITEIEPYTFCWCSNISGVTIPTSVVTIDSDAFCYCDSISVLEIPDSVTTIGVAAFMGSPVGTRSLTSVKIGSGVTKIGKSAFANQPNLVNATFADTESVWYFYSAPQAVPNYDYTGGTEIGAFSATDTAANATNLKSYTTSGYLYNNKYSTE